MNIVYFTEDQHKYSNLKQDYTSVSGLWKPYFKPFDSETVSIKKAYKVLDLKNYEITKKELSYDNPDFIDHINSISSVNVDEVLNLAQSYQKEWSDKAMLGTMFHKSQEDIDISNQYKINPFTGKKVPIVKWDIDPNYDNQSSPYPLIEVPDGYIPELLVKNDSKLVAGQADMAFIETINGVRYVDIDDWKTDGEIVIKPSFFNPKTGFQKMQYPFDHLYDTNMWKYALKISTYAKMMELEGFVVRNLAFTHVVINNDLKVVKSTRYPIAYKSHEVDLCLNLKK